MSDKVLVAVYGSLRSGMQNFIVNEHAGATLVGKGTTVDNHDLHRYAGCYFPSVSLAHSLAGKPVVVEVFETTQSGLEGPYDRLEGYPNFYNRTQIPVMLDNGEEVQAWIYHIDESQPDLVESGDWVQYCKELKDK